MKREDLFNIIAENSLEEISNEEALLNYSFQFLEEELISDGLEHCYYYSKDENNLELKINGLSFGRNICEDEKYDTLNLFIIEHDEELEKIDKSTTTKIFKKLYRVLNRCIRTNEEDIPESHILKEAQEIYNLNSIDALTSINLYLVTSSSLVGYKDVEPKDILGKRDLETNTIDLNLRVIDFKVLNLFQKNSRKIDINVEEFSSEPIKLLVPPNVSTSYKTAMAVFSGDFVFNIYREFGPRLIESNVRSFLQFKGKVNQGIKSTLQENPEMFLAYNNGLCITISDYEIDENSHLITLNDFQIVNGGQTSSSIYFLALEAKKNKKNIDLKRVYIPAKITRIGRNIDSNIIQKKIAINSNTQNPIKITDINSNKEFWVKLLSLCKNNRSPISNSYFYFEKSRGQYNVELSMSKKESEFEKIYPKRQKFDSTQFSLVFYALFDQASPYTAVKSGTKRYIEDLLPRLEKGEIKYLDSDYFQNFIGAMIVYKYFDNQYGVGKKNSIGRIKKNVVAYGLSFLKATLLRNKRDIDFNYFWKNCSLDFKNETNFICDKVLLKIYLKEINEYILKKFNDGRVDEGCKKESTWKTFLSEFKTSIDIDQLLPTKPLEKRKPNRQSTDKTEIIKTSYEILNSMLNVDTYIQAMKIIKDEISEYGQAGNSKYGRVHEKLIKDHYRPQKDKGIVTKLNPISFELIKQRLYNKNGVIIAKKLKEEIEKTQNIIRIIEEIKKDLE